LQVRLPRSSEQFLGLDPGESKALAKALSQLHRQFRAPPNLRALFEAALASEKLADVRFRAAAFKSRILELLLACIESSGRNRQLSLPKPIARALQSLEGNSADQIKLSELAAKAGLSESYFKMLFRQSMGMPPAEFLRVLRLERAQLQLRATSALITDIALTAGFSSSQHFATAFRQQYGCTPSRFRAGHASWPDAGQPLHGAGATFHPIEAKIPGAAPAVAQTDLRWERIRR
jgi:AraC-like DNA-binding protein